MGGVLPLSRYAVGVFYSPSRPGHRTLVGRVLLLSRVYSKENQRVTVRKERWRNTNTLLHFDIQQIHNSQKNENWILPGKGITIHHYSFRCFKCKNMYTTKKNCGGCSTCGSYGHKDLAEDCPNETKCFNHQENHSDFKRSCNILKRERERRREREREREREEGEREREWEKREKGIIRVK